MEKTVKIKLIIGDEETTAVMKIAQEALSDLTQQAATLGNNPMLKKFTQDLLEIGEVSEEAAEGVNEFIKYNGLSERQIGEELEALQANRKKLALNSEEYKKHNAALANISGAYDKLKVSQAQANPQMARQGFNSMNMVIGQTGFLLSDLDMMFVNYRMGMMSISNNISMVSSSIGYALNEAKARGVSFAQAFKESLTGANAVMLGVNAGLFALNAAPRILDMIGSSADGATKAIDGLAGAFDKLVKVKNPLDAKFFNLDKNTIEQLMIYFNDEIDTLEAKNTEKKIEVAKRAGVSPSQLDSRMFMSNLKPEEKAKNEENELILDKLKEQKAELEAQIRVTEIMKKAGIVPTGKEKDPEKLNLNTMGNIFEKIVDARMKEWMLTMDTELPALGNVTIEEMRRGSKSSFDLKTGKYVNPDSQKKEIMTPSQRVQEYLNTPEQVEEMQNFKSSTQELETTFRSLGNTMASSLSRGLMGLKSMKEMVGDLLGMLIEMGLKFAFTFGLNSLFPGAGTVAGAATGTIDVSRIGTMPFDNGANMGASTTILVNVTGSTLTRGRDILTSYDSTQQIKAAYK